MGELHRLPPLGSDGECGCHGYLHGAGAAVYLAAAGEGELRSRSNAGMRTSTVASMRVRASVLRALSAEASKHPSRPMPREVVTAAPGSTPAPELTPPTDVRALLSWMRRDSSLVGLRTSAAAHLASCGLLTGEMAQLRLEHLRADAVSGFDRNPRGPAAPLLTGAVLLDDATRAAVKEWLRARKQVVASPRVSHLFVTAKAAGYAGKAGDKVKHAGLPLTPRTLNRCHLDAVQTWLTQTNPGRSHEARLAVRELSMTRLADRFR